MKKFKDFLSELKVGANVYDVNTKKIGSVKKITKDIVTLSNGDQVNSDSFYIENDKLIVEL